MLILSAGLIEIGLAIKLVIVNVIWVLAAISAVA
jgi:hypothetical protein